MSTTQRSPGDHQPGHPAAVPDAGRPPLAGTEQTGGTAPATGSNGSPSTSLITFQSYGYTSPAGLDTTDVYRNTNRSGNVTTYTYDAAGRLTEARHMNGSTVLSDYQYTLSDHNTLTRQAVTGTDVTDATTSYGHTADNALCWSAPGAVTGTCSSPPAGATTYSFDNAGNLASTSNGLSASYNLQNQNSQLTPPGGQPFNMSYVDATSDRRTQAGDLRLSYDLLGLNTQGTNSGVPHSDWFVRDPSGTLVARRDSNSNNSNTRDLFYLFDRQGSVIATTGANAAVVHRYTYTPYGQETGADPADDNPWRYVSGYSDTATGMTKFGTRYYQPSLMNWTQTDPVAGNPANPMTLNPYAYAACNPINLVDTSGRSVCSLYRSLANWTFWPAWIYTGIALFTKYGYKPLSVAIWYYNGFLRLNMTVCDQLGEAGYEQFLLEQYGGPTT